MPTAVGQLDHALIYTQRHLSLMYCILSLYLHACCLLPVAVCASARELQQQQQAPLDIGGVLNQVGQAATQGLQGLLNSTNQGARQTANASRPLGGIGDALQNLGAVINNSTARNTTGAAPGRRPAPAAAAAEEQPSGPLLADTSEITSNATGGLGQLLSNLTTGLTNAAAGAQPQQSQQQQQKKEPEITPPPGVKSSAGAAAASWLAAAVLLVQLLV